MKITRKRQITWERERSVTIRFNDESTEKFCLGCQSAARFVTVDEAAAIGQTTARTIFRLVENGQIHFSETPGGRLFVCLLSLSNITDGATDSLTGSVEE